LESVSLFSNQVTLLCGGVFNSDVAGAARAVLTVVVLLLLCVNLGLVFVAVYWELRPPEKDTHAIAQEAEAMEYNDMVDAAHFTTNGTQDGHLFDEAEMHEEASEVPMFELAGNAFAKNASPDDHTSSHSSGDEVSPRGRSSSGTRKTGMIGVDLGLGEQGQDLEHVDDEFDLGNLRDDRLSKKERRQSQIIADNQMKFEIQETPVVTGDVYSSPQQYSQYSSPGYSTGYSTGQPQYPTSGQAYSAGQPNAPYGTNQPAMQTDVEWDLPGM